ncbi:hypothetical protein ACS0TY_031436 [Phlomoides rotata]
MIAVTKWDDWIEKRLAAAENEAIFRFRLHFWWRFSTLLASLPDRIIPYCSELSLILELSRLKWKAFSSFELSSIQIIVESEHLRSPPQGNSVQFFEGKRESWKKLRKPINPTSLSLSLSLMLFLSN